MFDYQPPLPSCIIPSSTLDLMAKFHAFVDMILLCYITHIFVNLLRGGVVVWPVRIGLKRICIIVSWDITLTSWVSVLLSVQHHKITIRSLPVLQPSSSQVLIPFINRKVNILLLHSLIMHNSHHQSRISSSHADNPQRSSISKWFLIDAVIWIYPLWLDILNWNWMNCLFWQWLRYRFNMLCRCINHAWSHVGETNLLEVSLS